MGAAATPTYEVLAGLESTAIEILIRKQLGAGELQKLVSAARAMEKSLAGENLEGWSEADALFHNILFDLAGNQTLIAAAGQFREKISRVRLLSYDPDWGTGDNAVWQGHGTAMAGIALYGDMLPLILGNGPQHRAPLGPGSVPHL